MLRSPARKPKMSLKQKREPTTTKHVLGGALLFTQTSATIIMLLVIVKTITL
jgi:hypothetical protein